MAQYTQYINFASGEVLPFTITKEDLYIDENIDIDDIIWQINNNYIAPIFRIYVLHPDESVNYLIPPQDIQVGGSFNENYQNGQRRSLSFTLYNESGNYTPNIDVFWSGTRLRLDMGITLSSGSTVWFTKGIFVITQITPSYSSTSKQVNISASDKFSLFESKTGRIDSTYEIPIGSNIRDVIADILLKDMGNGNPLDSKPIIYHSLLKDKVTQATITKSAGDTLGSILIDLANQLSAEIFYNASGHLVLIPLNEVDQDNIKPLIYNYDTSVGGISQLDFNFNMDEVVNKVIVLGNSTNGGYYRAEAINDNPASPTCYQRIGIRLGDIVNDSNISSDVLAQERADYELRQQLIIKTSTSAQVLFNPLLEVNNIITISDEFFNLQYERFLLQSISFPLDFSGAMNITFSNVVNLPFITRS